MFYVPDVLKQRIQLKELELPSHDSPNKYTTLYNLEKKSVKELIYILDSDLVWRMQFMIIKG